MVMSVTASALGSKRSAGVRRKRRMPVRRVSRNPLWLEIVGQKAVK
jgi:hypothetical protein